MDNNIMLREYQDCILYNFEVDLKDKLDLFDLILDISNTLQKFISIPMDNQYDILWRKIHKLKSLAYILRMHYLVINLELFRKLEHDLKKWSENFKNIHITARYFRERLIIKYNNISYIHDDISKSQHNIIHSELLGLIKSKDYELADCLELFNLIFEISAIFAYQIEHGSDFGILWSKIHKTKGLAAILGLYSVVVKFEVFRDLKQDINEWSRYFDYIYIPAKHVFNNIELIYDNTHIPTTSNVSFTIDFSDFFRNPIKKPPTPTKESQIDNKPTTNLIRKLSTSRSKPCEYNTNSRHIKLKPPVPRLSNKRPSKIHVRPQTHISSNTLSLDTKNYV